ncbi:MAG: ECF transporter S component [Tepidanaerobacteraceae bacterium]|jgi:riboflavin transporter FmnP|nr:ECF transporter S component [Tepidanaerobacteraceae bacterium]
MTAVNQKTFKSEIYQTRNMTKIAVLGVLAFIIMFAEFPLPMFAAFLKIDFSDVPALLAGFSMGPWAGIMVEVVKNFLHLFKSQTAFIGEAANLLTGILLVAPASMIYSAHKSKKTAIIGLLAGTVIMAAGMSIANYFCIVPLYQKILNIPTQAVIAMGSQANARIIDLKTLVVYGILPFNIIKGILLTIATALIYKRLSPLLHR